MSRTSSLTHNPDPGANNLQNGVAASPAEHQPSRPKHSRKKSFSSNDAYLYALRVAYLAYLLQPRSKRTRYTTPRPPVHRTATSTSINELMKDFSLVKDSKNTRLPHDFVKELDKRLQSVVVGKEKKPEYQDATVKRTFAAFYNTFSEPGFKKRMEQDRRVEELVLIFFSNATKELQKGKPPGDEAIKRLVDRHVALFVRLLSLILKDKGWALDKPELATRLQTLEQKLLKHDEDLSTPDGGVSEKIEEVVPLTYEVKDMALVQVVGQIFGLKNTVMQSDIDKHKSAWTERAALKDLKSYQTRLNANSRGVLRSFDFDSHEAYEIWKKSETPELLQMMLTIMQANPELAKSIPNTDLSLLQIKSNPGSTAGTDATYSDVSRVLSQPEENRASYVLDLPDLSSLSLSPEEPGTPLAREPSRDDEVYTFIPPDPRWTYRFIVLQTLSYNLTNPSVVDGSPDPHLLSKQSIELLHEIATRWRIPNSSRIVLYLDTVREKFAEKAMTLDMVDAAFNHVKEIQIEESKQKRSSLVVKSDSILQERHLWPLVDYALMQKMLVRVHDDLLKDLRDAVLTAYDDKAQLQTAGIVMTLLDDHILNDPGFSRNQHSFNDFKNRVIDGLANRAREVYTDALEAELPQEQEKWEFYHVQQLAKRILKLAEKVQKRFKQNPEILGINPLMIMLNIALPAFAEDSKAMVEQIYTYVKSQGFEVPIQDGFDLYQNLSEFRKVHADALPHVPFPYKVEELLADFVWRWIQITEQQVSGWVENAVKQDHFTVRTANPNQTPTEDERHSVSVIDIFRSFSQVIEQIARLNWDDDLGYAKFMTAVSKAVANGITRYCELVDQLFTKEMDRLSPEQEAAANMTRQEKWVQLAKDTWNNRERVEPFHFYAQSFVKLNNISFAIHQWDKLESEVNVDACAEVIKKNSPPPIQRQRKTSNYVFTIKIVEGEDLKSCDVNGYSDPYVVLTDEYQKRLSKTRIIYRNLNPRWDESVDITTQGPLNLIATIWDWDVLGDHDYVGRTSLKLDPAHFGDFLPREYWLDLDTQGRLLVRVSMEGERDDIQFYFGKAFRILQRTQRDMTRKITDKLSAYIHYCLSRRALKSLLNKGISISTVSSYFGRNRAAATPTSSMPTEVEIVNALKPLFAYFDDNFAIMNQTLTSDAMIAVMTRLWKEVLATIESLLVPPLSDKISQQRPLSQQELDVVFKWLQSLFDFFHAVDDETGEANGVPINVLKSPKYHEIQTLNFFYFETTENLIRTSERMASATAANQQAQRTRLSAPPSLGTGFGGGLLAAGSVPAARRAKSIMLSRNLGTMKKAKEEKWKQAQAEPSDDMILRLLRMRPEAGGYLRDRSRQKERLAAAAAAEMIVRQSLLAGGGRMTGPSVVKR